MALEKITLELTGSRTIHCGSCENAIRRALSPLPGVRLVEASHRSQLIQIALDPRNTSVDRVRERLAWMGYAIRQGSE